MMASQEVIADIEAEAGNIETAEKELASFTQDLSVFASMSAPMRRGSLGLLILVLFERYWLK